MDRQYQTEKNVGQMQVDEQATFRGKKDSKIGERFNDIEVK